jgi:hypothetical protein
MVYMAPAGSREKNCSRFKVRHSGRTTLCQTGKSLIYADLRRAWDDRLIARFQPAGIGRFAMRARTEFLPISIEGGKGWKKYLLDIRYGEVFEIPPKMRNHKDKAVAFLEDQLLAVMEKP